MELHFLNTAWSDIIILKNGDDAAMIDTGFDFQFSAINDYLNKLNINTISFILLTHFHKDHYGSIPSIVKNFDVKRVYFKDYSALDRIGDSGDTAGAEYRKKEHSKCLEIKEIIRENSELVPVENLDRIKFGQYDLKLYNTGNIIKKVYEDAGNKDSYHKILLNENQNSLAVFMRIGKVNVFFGGDIFDGDSVHPEVSHMNYRIASSIGERINIYKAAHHGTSNSNSKETLNIFKPEIAVVTNGEDFLQNDTTLYQDLTAANKEVKILTTAAGNIVINVSDDGTIEIKAK